MCFFGSYARPCWVFLLVLVCFFPSFASAAERVSLIKSIETAFAYNPDLKASQESAEQARHAVTKARSGYMPKVAVYGGVGINQTNDVGTRASNDNNTFDGTADAALRLTQPLWRGGAVVAEVATRKAQLESATAMLEDKGISLAFDVIAAHTDLVVREKLVQLAKRNVTAHEAILRIIQQRFQANVATVGELKQVEGRVARAKATLSAYESTFDAASSRYSHLTGVRGIGLAPALLPKTQFSGLDALRDACLAGNRRIKAALMDVRAAQGERDMARGGLFPKFDLEAGPTWSTIDRENGRREQSLDAGLRMSWELYSGGRDLANIRMAGAKMRQSRHALHSLMDTLNDELETTLSTYERAQVQIHEYTVAQQSSVVTRDDFQRQFEAAQRTLIDVLDAESDYFYAASQLVMVQNNHVLAGYRLLAITGTLLEELHIAPPKYIGANENSASVNTLRTSTPSLLHQKEPVIHGSF